MGFSIFCQRFRKPQNIIEANSAIIIFLKIIGLIPIVTNFEDNKNIKYPISHIIISTIIISFYIISTIDQFSIDDNNNYFGNVKKTIQFVGVLLQLTSSAVAVVVSYSSVYFHTKCYVNIFTKILQFDRNFAYKEIIDINKKLLKISTYLIVFGLLNAIPLLWFFINRTSALLGFRGVIRCILYILSFLNINGLFYNYISIIYILKQRFKLTGDKLKFNVKNNKSKTIFTLLRYHTDLSDIKLCINSTSIGLTINFCLLANFVNAIYDILSAILSFTYSKDVEDGSILSIFTIWWQIFNLLPILLMAEVCGKCSEEVSSIQNIIEIYVWSYEALVN